MRGGDLNRRLKAWDALDRGMSDMFTDDQIDAYIKLKMEDIIRFEHAPHPVEFDMYYSS